MSSILPFFEVPSSVLSLWQQTPSALPTFRYLQIFAAWSENGRYLAPRHCSYIYSGRSQYMVIWALWVNLHDICLLIHELRAVLCIQLMSPTDQITPVVLLHPPTGLCTYFLEGSRYLLIWTLWANLHDVYHLIHDIISSIMLPSDERQESNGNRRSHAHFHRAV